MVPGHEKRPQLQKRLPNLPLEGGITDQLAVLESPAAPLACTRKARAPGAVCQAVRGCVSFLPIPARDVRLLLLCTPALSPQDFTLVVVQNPNAEQ